MNHLLELNLKSSSRVLLAVALGCILSSRSFAQSTNFTGSEQGLVLGEVQTDRSRYDPGDTVFFNLKFNSSVDSCYVLVRYWHLGYFMGQDSLAVHSTFQTGWSWIPPLSDYEGYFVDIFLMKSGELLDHAGTAVDVSSSWDRFPRYGFLSSYPAMVQSEMDSVVDVLNRYHINGLQFYDWQYKHNMPLKGTPQEPAPYWNDIANRINYFGTVSGYIQAAHRHSMKAMSYNLLYGAYANADQDGVITEWSLYSDTGHQSREVIQLPAGWASSIYLMDPSNEQWRAYLLRQEDSAFKALAFDGWHIDQIGDWGTMYNYAGQPVVVSDAFTSFIQEAKSYLTEDMVMNAVNQYGQSNIAKAPVDFLYTEVWDPSVNYSDLTSIINRNYAYSGGQLNTVLAAYMDYDLGNNTGWFSTPGVLMTDAIIFASGGDHIELGEHMLCKEYFPNGNLQMTPELRKDLVNYYDFLTAYENLLRDSMQTSSVLLSTTSNTPISPVQQLGTVWYFAKQKKNLQIIQFLNYVNASNLLWRDRNGSQPEPDTIKDLQVSFLTSHVVNRIWTASPDFYDGASADVPFTQDSGKVSFILGHTKYWDMVVIEYDSTLTSALNGAIKQPLGFSLAQNYPNPFNPSTTISFNLKEKSSVKIEIYNILGQRILEHDIGQVVAGSYKIPFDLSHYASSVYFYRLHASGENGENFTSTKKMLLIK